MGIKKIIIFGTPKPESVRGGGKKYLFFISPLVISIALSQQGLPVCPLKITVTHKGLLIYLL